MDLTLRMTAGRRTIEAYGGGGFRLSGESHQGSILVFPDGVLPWSATQAADLTLPSLRPIFERAKDLDLVLVGCGLTFMGLPLDLRTAFREAGLGVEIMDTGAACRTLNVLTLEDRRVAAALLAI